MGAIGLILFSHLSQSFPPLLSPLFYHFALLNDFFTLWMWCYITTREVQRGVDGWIYKNKVAALRQNKSDI